MPKKKVFCMRMGSALSMKKSKHNGPNTTNGQKYGLNIWPL